MSPESHFLIGVPGAGKSTFAREWVQRDSNCCIVSTDAIRAELYGDEQIQGDWGTIEALVLERVSDAIASGKSVIYDATNAKRSWRMTMLQKFATIGATQWIGWHFTTPLVECQRRNMERARQVDEEVITGFAVALADFPPIAAEGFIAVYPVPLQKGEVDFKQIWRQVQQLSRAITNRQNRTRNLQLHRYSKLLDFERLMYLIALLIRYPGAGQLQTTNPDLLQQLLGREFEGSSIAEVCALMASLYHPIYAEEGAIASDLTWLEANGIIGEERLDLDMEIPAYSGNASDLVAHTYSDLDTIGRLLKTIRLLAHYPHFVTEEDQKSLESFSAILQQQVYTSTAILRKDIENVLKPYQILPPTPMKRGYFIGTAILAKHELLEVFKVLQSQVESLEDPVAVGIYQDFKNKLTLSRLLTPDEASNHYPIRAIGNQSIVDIDALPDYAVYRKLDVLTDAMGSGTLLEVSRITGTGRFTDDPHQEQPFRIYPLQIKFHNIGWYLGYECASDSPPHLFRFERLDRLFVVRTFDQHRTQAEQRQALAQLDKLYRASAGLFLGNSAADQQKYLSGGKLRAEVEETLELWCNDDSFRFISEGTKRFPAAQIKMSKRLGGGQHNLNKKMFSLSTSNDLNFPHRCQVKLPYWSFSDVDLLRWIIGFGGKVKVVSPCFLADKVKTIGSDIVQAYQD